MTTFKVGDKVKFGPTRQINEQFIDSRIKEMGPGPYEIVAVFNLLDGTRSCDCGVGNGELNYDKHNEECSAGVALRTGLNQLVNVVARDGLEWRGFSGWWFQLAQQPTHKEIADAKIETNASLTQYYPAFRNISNKKIAVTRQNGDVIVQEEAGYPERVRMRCNGIQLRFIIDESFCYLLTDGRNAPMSIEEMFLALGGKREAISADAF